MTQNQYRHSTTPGRVDSSALLCGGLGLLLSGVLYWVGLLGRGDLKILNLLSDAVFGGAAPSVLSAPVLITITALFCFGIAFAVLDSCGVWRRLILGITLMVLVLAMVPTLAVWDIYFPPMMSLVGVFWAWFAGILYASHYQMPCDSITQAIEQPEPVVVQPKVLEELPEAKPKNQAVKKNSKKKAKKKKSDPDAKYKPKE